MGKSFVLFQIRAPRMIDDSKSIWETCIELGWSSERMQGWRAPEHFKDFDSEGITILERTAALSGERQRMNQRDEPDAPEGGGNKGEVRERDARFWREFEQLWDLEKNEGEAGE
jgi:hypothetical protein